MLWVILKANNLLECFMKKNSKTQIQKKFELKKGIKRKGNKLNVKWQGSDSFFKNWIGKKDIV